MYCSPLETRKARMHHRCTWCGQHIQPGETYHRWISIDCSMFTNKMHDECHAVASADDDEYEYSQYENERPIKEAA